MPVLEVKMYILINQFSIKYASILEGGQCFTYLKELGQLSGNVSIYQL